MNAPALLVVLTALAPVILMASIALLAPISRATAPSLWRLLQRLAIVAVAAATAGLAVQVAAAAGALQAPASPVLASVGLAVTPPAAWLAVLVQLLGLVIASFSSRYLQGEPGQARYIAALAGVLAAVQLLLLADHWLVLIGAWSVVGACLHRLLCFYPDRPFALLAAHKKRLADVLADLLLIAAAALAWTEVGSGSLSDLWHHLASTPASPSLQASAVLLALAVVLRTALLPVHGWLMQVMEAPTPVSALLHAGVVNLGGFVLIRFAPLLEAAPTARWLLIGAGLATAFLAGLVMLTRISIKVRLAWSTAAQMGFMVLECGLGLYTLALLHLIGHSLYKAHAFLGSSNAVRETRLRMMRAPALPSVASLLVAPVAAGAIVLAGQWLVAPGTWPAWWSGVLALAWAPMLWLPARAADAHPPIAFCAMAGALAVIALTAAALAAHALPLGVADAPFASAGITALLAMAALYACLVAVQLRATRLAALRRWIYAGFYLDEIYTRVALAIWPARWTSPTTPYNARPTDAEPLPASR